MDGICSKWSVFCGEYKLGKTLGVGSFTKVKIAEHTLTGKKVAVKVFSRRKIQDAVMEERVEREIEIMGLLKNPHIIQFYEVIETPDDIYMVMEYVESGELFDYVVEKGRLQEDDACKIFQQLIDGVEYCHSKMVVHRDLRLENLLLDSDFNVKIADFGFGNIMKESQFLKTSYRNPIAAPEVI